MVPDVTKKFSEFVQKTHYSDLPKEVIGQAKDYILDSIGCTLGGYGIPEGVLITKLAKEFGDASGGTILPNGQKTSYPGAAYVNSKLGNLIDADETLYNYYHIGCVPLYSALHAGEKIGATGRDILTAIILGYEFAYRFCQSYALLTVTKSGMEIVKTSGYGFNCIAGAVAASKVLKLDTKGIRNAMGIAGYYTPLPLISKFLYTMPMGMLKYQDMGWFALVGLIAALFSENGYTGDQFIIDDIGDYSFWKAFGMLEFDFNTMTANLGEKWGIMEMGIKPYPCCRWFHTPIHLIKKIMKENNLAPDDIKTITIKLHPVVAQSELFKNLSNWSVWEPKDAVHSQLSTAYSIACAVYDIPVGPLWQSPETLSNPKLVEFCKKVFTVQDDKCVQKMSAYLKSDQQKGKLMAQVHYTVEVSSNKGIFTESAEYIYGDTYDPDHRLSRVDLKQKFAHNSSAILDKNLTEKIIDATYDLDRFDDINDFTRMFT